MFWILVLSYWTHLLATAVWVAGVLAMAATAVPALRQASLTDNQWLKLQKQLLPWTNLSLVLLLLTGFLQMTNNTGYQGFLAIEGTWAQAMLVKHIVFFLVIGVAAYWQFVYFPAVERTAVLVAGKPQLAQSERAKLARREKQLLWLNVGCAVIILFCTAVMTAV